MKRLLFILVGTLVLQTAHGQDILNRAKAALSARDTTAAINGFQEAVRVGQRPFEANYFLGAIAHARGDEDAAVNYLQTSLRNRDDNVDALKLLGEIQLKRGDAQGALQNFRRAARLAPRDVHISAGYGLALLAVDSTDAAIVNLTRAKEHNDSPLILMALGDAYVKQGVPILGVTNYQAAIAKEPENLSYRMKLAELYERNRQYTEAVQEYNQVVRIDSTFADAYLKIGSILVRAKRHREAVVPLKSYVGLRPSDVEGQVLYATALFHASVFSEAAVVAERVLQSDSSDAEIWRIYASSLSENKEHEKAVRAFQSLQRRDKLQADDLVKYGNSLLALGRRDEALAALMKVVQEDSTNCEPYFNLGSILMTMQRFGEAAGMFEKRIECDSRSISSYINAAACHMQEKNYSRARELLMTALEMRPDILQIRLWLARYYAQVDSLALAKQQYDEVLRQIGNETDKYKREAAEAHYLTGSYHFIQKDYNSAINSFQRAFALGQDNAAIHLSWGQSLILSRGDDAEVNRRKVEEAVKRFRRCLELDNTSAQGWLWLAQSLLFLRIEGEDEDNRKLNDEACTAYKRVLRLDPRNDDAKKGMERIGCK